jgi:hypothetical protein
MLTHAPPTHDPRICCDASQLPVQAGTVNAAVLVDAFCFPRELDRILTPAGAIVWINLLGEDGPLYVPNTDITTCLPGSWTTLESRAGWGTWAILKRARC